MASPATIPAILPKYIEIVYNEEDVSPAAQETECLTSKAAIVVDTQPYEIPISGVVVVDNNLNNNNPTNNSTTLSHPNYNKDSGSYHIDIPNSGSIGNNINCSNLSSIVSIPGGDDSMQTLLPQVTPVADP